MLLRVEHGAIVLAVLLASACGGDSKDPTDAGGANNTGGTQGPNNGVANNNGGNAGTNAGNNGGNAGNNASGGNTGNDANGGVSTTGGSTGGSTTGSSTGGTTGGTTGATTGGTTGGTPCDASTAPIVPKLGLETVIALTAQDRLVYAAQPPGSSDWYLVLQAGEIKVLTGGTVRGTNFLDVAVALPPSAEDERGLLGLTFAPDYATSGKFYIALTPAGTNIDEVREYTRSSADPFVADPGSMKEVVKLPSSAGNHNGGIVRFGPDNMLYVGTGDGGGGCSDNQGDAPQDVNELFGKILRLDPSKTAPNNGASGNPFATDGDARVYHYGLRNPYRFNFDRATGDLYIGDVGQVDYEEVSFAANGVAGLNFGWPAYEGDALTSTTCKTSGAAFDLREGSTHTPPIFQTKRKNPNKDARFGDWVSVIGGVVYRGAAFPALTGVYLFGDYQGARMAALCRTGSQTSPVTAFKKQCDIQNPNDPESCLTPKSGAAQLGELMAIVEGNDGEVYLVGNHSTLYKVVPN